MRPIEFRFYKPSTNKMIYPENFTSADLIESEDWKVMQFTGRLDKNGKKIFEGDIYTTNHKHCPNFNYAVYFKEGAFCGGKSENSLTPLFWKSDDNEDLIIVDNFNELIKVIGNIHQNPELL